MQVGNTDLCNKHLQTKMQLYFKGERFQFQVCIHFKVSLLLSEYLASFCRQVRMFLANCGQPWQSASDHSTAAYTCLPLISPCDCLQPTSRSLPYYPGARPVWPLVNKILTIYQILYILIIFRLME